MRKILFANFVAETSGSVKSLYYLVEELANHFQIEVVFAKKGDYQYKLQELGCYVKIVNIAQLANTEHQKYRFDVETIIRILYFFVRTPFDIARWMVLIKARNPSLLYVNNTVMLAPAIAARILRIKVVWHIRELISDNWLGRFQMRIILKLGDRLLFTTKYACNKFPKSDKKFVTYNGISVKTQLIDHNCDKIDFTKLGSVKTVMMWSNLNFKLIEPKGFLVFIDAAEILSNKRKDVVFLIAGGNKESAAYNALKDYIETKALVNFVFLLGHVSNILSCVSKVDICVAPHKKREPFGRTILEAGVCSKPIISSRLEPTTEIIEDGRNGLLFEVGNAEDLASKISLLIDDPKLCTNLASRLNSDVNEKYEIGKVNKSIHRLISELV